MKSSVLTMMTMIRAMYLFQRQRQQGGTIPRPPAATFRQSPQVARSAKYHLMIHLKRRMKPLRLHLAPARQRRPRKMRPTDLRRVMDLAFGVMATMIVSLWTSLLPKAAAAVVASPIVVVPECPLPRLINPTRALPLKKLSVARRILETRHHRRHPPLALSPSFKVAVWTGSPGARARKARASLAVANLRRESQEAAVYFKGSSGKEKMRPRMDPLLSRKLSRIAKGG